MVLEAFATCVVREREQEVVAVVVMGAVHGRSFMHQVVERSEKLRAQINIFGRIAGDVEEVLRRDIWGERDFPEVLAGEDGRVLEHLDAQRSEVRRVAVGSGGSERGANAPSGGDFHGRLNLDIADGDAGWIKEEFFPFKHGQLVGDARGNDSSTWASMEVTPGGIVRWKA